MSTSSFLPALPAFAAQRDTSFAVLEHDGLALTLIEANTLDPRAPDERRFSLLLRGPAAPILEQATYSLAHPVLETQAIFLVPVARDAGGAQYQAIFN